MKIPVGSSHLCSLIHQLAHVATVVERSAANSSADRPLTVRQGRYKGSHTPLSSSGVGFACKVPESFEDEQRSKSRTCSSIHNSPHRANLRLHSFVRYCPDTSSHCWHHRV